MSPSTRPNSNDVHLVNDEQVRSFVRYEHIDLIGSFKNTLLEAMSFKIFWSFQYITVLIFTTTH